MKKTGVQYRYARNENDELIEIHRAHSIGGEYHCPECGKKMICKCGSKNAWHFAHNKSECDYNKYLHTIAEERFSEWFNTSNEVPLVLKTNAVCDNSTNCKFFRKEFCAQEIDSEGFNLKDYYTICEKEKGFEKSGQRFVADLLCIPKNEKNEPLFIEICVTHPCEKEKIESGIRIIEFVIQSEEDIEDIVGTQIRASKKIRLYNFHPRNQFSSSILKIRSLQKFILYPSKKGYVKNILCGALSDRRGIIEITIPPNDNEPEFINNRDFYRVALAVATHYNISIKHCYLCKYYVLETLFGYGRCDLFNKYDHSEKSSENNAIHCSYFMMDEEALRLIRDEFIVRGEKEGADIWLNTKVIDII